MIVVPSSRILEIALCAALCLACPADDANRESGSPPIWPGGDLVSVDLIDESRAVVVTAAGEIYFTRDLGSTWQRSHVPAVAGLRSVSMSSAGSGWAVGEGVILRTDDGGSSWRRQRLPMLADRIRLGSVVAIDSEHAIAVSSDGTRLATGNAGRVWQRVSREEAEPSDLHRNVAAVDCDPDSRRRCWFAGSVLRSTNDAGETWQPVEVDDLARIDPIVFGVARVEVVAAERERFEGFIAANRYRTRLTWRLEPGISPIELEEIGRQRDPEALFALIDARLQELRSMIEEAGSPADLVVEVAEPPWDYADYLDDDPEILERYWSARAAPQPSVVVRLVARLRLASVRLGPRHLGIAVGEHGALIRSVDRGEHWARLAPVSRDDLQDVGFGNQRVVAVGAQGRLWLSEDEGLSWHPPRSTGDAAFFDVLRSISFSPSGQAGLIVGENGRMLRSLDGGIDWERLTRDAA